MYCDVSFHLYWHGCILFYTLKIIIASFTCLSTSSYYLFPLLCISWQLYVLLALVAFIFSFVTNFIWCCPANRVPFMMLMQYGNAIILTVK